MATPSFNGDDAKGWKRRCEELFLVDETPNNRKVMYAAIKFEGRALHWHQLYAKTSGKSLLDMSWDDYSRATLLHFGEEPELADELLQIQKALSNLQLALARVEEDVSRLQKQSLMIQESSDEIELAECGEKSETAGIHSQTDSFSSLYYDDSNSVSFRTEIRMNFEVENSAHQVFDEMPDRNLGGIEVEFSDISLIRTILSNNSVGSVDKGEVNSEIEISVHKVFDEIPVRIRDEITDFVSVSDKVALNNEDDNVDVDSVSSKLVFRHLHFKNKIEDLNHDVIVKVSRSVVLEFSFFNAIEYCVCDFCGQKYLKKGVVDINSIVMEIGSFGWKPGWINVDDQVDMKTNGAVNKVKDIKEYVCLENGSFSAFNWKSCWILVMNKEFVVINTKKRWLLGFVSTIFGSFEWKPGWLIFVRNNNELQMGFVSSSVGKKLLKKCLMDKSVVIIKNESVVKLILGVALKIKMGYKYRNAQDSSEVVHSELRNGLKESELVVMKTDVILMDLDDGQQELESVMGDLVKFIENSSIPTLVIHTNGYDPEVVMAEKSFLISGTKVQISSYPPGVRVRLEIFTFVAKVALVAKCHLAVVHRHKDVFQWQLIGRPGNCYDVLGGALMNRGQEVM